LSNFAWTDNNIPADEVRRVYAECNGDLKACAHAWHVSYDKAKWEIERLGLDNVKGEPPPEDGEGAMGRAEFVALVWTARILSTNWRSRRQAYDPAALTKPCDQCGRRIRIGFRCGRCFPEISEEEWKMMLTRIPKCPGCGATVAKEGDVCGHCLDAALPVVLAAEEKKNEEQNGNAES
jgi:hypothetical protein